MVEALRRRKDRWGWKGNDGDAHAAADRLRAERIAGNHVEDAIDGYAASYPRSPEPNPTENLAFDGLPAPALT